MKIKCITVDDEFLALQLLEQYINRVSSLELVAQCEDGLSAITALQTHNDIDLIFLDIQMPNLSGLDMLATLKHPPAVIFTTAYSEHALEAFQLDAVDYLLKPFSFQRFLQAVNKATERVQYKRQRMSGNTSNNNSADASVEEPVKDHFFVKADYKMVKIRYDDIFYIEGLREYVCIYTTQKRIITLESMKNLVSILPANHFMRTHKSYIVSIDKVDAFSGNTLEINGKTIPISKSYKEEVMIKIK